ncbi:YbaB/EbfC family nucleoid-associated protein [Nocardia amikacinitolerans]|uniref:YbaB/EbfC family nucleoid-associated protein n=1 Tax=Nocardia amikacinitolerans TaxID=756689 RepID=UPI0036C348C0
MDNKLDQTIADLGRYAESLENTAKKYDDLQRSMAALSVTESTDDGRISVTVDSNGVPTAIDLAASTRGMDPAAVSAGIMSCLHRAQAKLRGRVTDLVHDLVGNDAPAADMVGRYAERFPDPEPADAATTSPTPGSPPTYAPPQSTYSSPPAPPSPSAYAPPSAPPPFYSSTPTPDFAPPPSRKPNRDQVVTPDEPDEDDEYYNRKSWLI